MAIVSPREWDYDSNGGYFTIEDTKLWFYPSLVAGDEIEILYYKSIPALTDSNTTNWLLTNYPDIYLWGCMKMAGVFTRDDDLIRRASTMYDRAVMQMKGDDFDKKYGQGTVQIRAVW